MQWNFINTINLAALLLFALPEVICLARGKYKWERPEVGRLWFVVLEPTLAAGVALTMLICVNSPLFAFPDADRFVIYLFVLLAGVLSGVLLWAFYAARPSGLYIIALILVQTAVFTACGVLLSYWPLTVMGALYGALRLVRVIMPRCRREADGRQAQ
ncbi:MAG: hypothetical protein Q4B99_02905 [Clostridia bacterium]|nr:hypothetical protein [Clostridia bacterium]